MTLEEFQIAWKQLAGKQKAIIAGLVLIFAALMISGWIDSFTSWRQIRKFENEAIAARRDADEALKKAAKIAADIKLREDALAKVEAKKEEKKNEVDQAHKETGDARADYDRAVRESRVSTNELCAELAALGYPCTN